VGAGFVSSTLKGAMPMAIASTTGARVYLGPTTAAATASAYSGLSYTEIGEVESIGEFGDQASTITFTSLGDARVRKRKGVRDAGDLNVVVANDPRNAGQIAMIAAQATEFTYAFKIVLADAPDANDTDSVFYFHGLVASTRLNVGAANEIIKRTFAILIDTAIIEVPSEAVT
jgi:hypothetical protein